MSRSGRPYAWGMATIRVSTIIDATPDRVWAVVENVADHVDWMHDTMEITEWEDGTTIGVRHVGIVTGTGAFTIVPVGTSRTGFQWKESLRFPWWMGGPLGALVGGQVLRLIWKRNLKGLKAIVEAR